MTTLTLDPAAAVLLVHGVTDGWAVVDAECPDCDGCPERDPFRDCRTCAGSGRNPLLDLVPGAPCPTCNGLKRTDVARGGDGYHWCSDCSGSGLLTVTIATTTQPPEPGWFGDLKYDPKLESLVGRVTELWPVPLGAVVGTGTPTDIISIVDAASANGRNGHDEFICHHGRLWMMRQHPRNSPEMGWAPELGENIDHLLPYADWTPGRWAVRLTNLTPKDPT